MSAVATVIHVKDLDELRSVLPAKGREAEAWIRGGVDRYWWDASSTAADDGDEVIKPSALPEPDPEDIPECACDAVTGAGRWRKMPCCADLRYDETPGGVIDGVNDTFILANPPKPAASLQLYKNGLRMKRGGDYSLASDTITFVAGAIPQTGDVLVADYTT